MATNVMLPQWGMNMEDGLLVKWLVKEGDTVEKGQPLVEVETAKINSELEAPESGVVAHIMASEGATVDVGTLVAVIAEPGESVVRPSETRPQKSPSSARRASPSASTATRERGAGAAPQAALSVAERRGGLPAQGRRDGVQRSAVPRHPGPRALAVRHPLFRLAQGDPPRHVSARRGARAAAPGGARTGR